MALPSPNLPGMTIVTDPTTEKLADLKQGSRS